MNRTILAVQCLAASVRHYKDDILRMVRRDFFLPEDSPRVIITTYLLLFAAQRFSETVVYLESGMFNTHPSTLFIRDARDEILETMPEWITSRREHLSDAELQFTTAEAFSLIEEMRYKANALLQVSTALNNCVEAML